MAELRDFEREAARAWLQRQRGDTSQEVLAEDITRTTGWTITRDRYSKYESGSLPFGKVVLEHFMAYWTAKGRPAPDFTPPPPQLSLEERAVIAAEAQADAIADLVVELRAWRTADRDRLAGQENLMTGVLASLAQLGVAPATPRAPLSPGQ